MKKVITLLMIGVGLAACEPHQEQVQRIKNQLPAGCKFYDLGSYERIDNLVMIRCTDGKVTTQGYDKRAKQSSRQYSLTVDG